MHLGCGNIVAKKLDYFLKGGEDITGGIKMEVVLLFTGHLFICAVWAILMFASLFIIMSAGELGAVISQIVRAVLMIIFGSYCVYNILPQHGIETNVFAVGIMWLLVYLPAFIEGRFTDRGQGYDNLSNVSAQASESQSNARMEEFIQFGGIVILLLFSKSIYGAISGPDGLDTIFNFLFSSQIVIILLGCIGAVWLGWNWVTFILSRKN